MKTTHCFLLLVAILLADSLCSSAYANPFSGIDKSHLDVNVSLQNDFYEYACGGWIKNNPIPKDASSYFVARKVSENNQLQIKELIEEVVSRKNEKGSVSDKIAAIYKLGMDSTKLNEDGFTPVMHELKAVAGITNRDQLQTTLARHHLSGIYSFFAFYVAPDSYNSSTNVGWLFQSGMPMGDRDYYIDTTIRAEKLRASYLHMVSSMFNHAKVARLFSENKTEKELAEAVLAVETRLARAAMTRLEQRVPQNIANYKTIAELQQLVLSIDFSAYFSALGIPDIAGLNVAQTAYMAEVNTLLASASLDDIKAYLSWQVLNHAASYLGDNAASESFAFFGTALSGREQQQPRWKRVQAMLDKTLGEAVGQLYVEKYFSPEAKLRMQVLVANLQAAMDNRIRKLDWMSNETKQQALEKLGTLRVKIGYPDTWRDYSLLQVDADSYYAAYLRSQQFEVAYNRSKLGKLVDPTGWRMNPQMLNAYYSSSTNEMCFPAAMLQPPFFNPEADDAVNYGAVGMVIGHEMTHGFDNHGRQFDKDGNLKDWWTKEDADRFSERAQALVEYFNKIELLTGMFANGALTLGENIADAGGVNLAFDAMQKAKHEGTIADTLDGFTAEQLFFLAFAFSWAGSMREQEMVRYTKQDVHSIGRWRVNATLKHIQPFYDAFGVVEGDGMYLTPEDRISIW